MNFVRKYWKTAFVIVAVGYLLHSMRKSLHQDLATLANGPKPSVSLLALAGLLFLLQYLVQAIGWHGIIRALKQEASPRLTMRMWYMSLIARWMPGRVLYTASRLMLARDNGLSVPAVSFAIVMELVYILVGGVIVTIAFAGGLLKGMLHTHTGQEILGGVALLVLVFGALAANPKTLLKMYDIKLFRKILNKIAGQELDKSAIPTMSTASSIALLAYFSLYWVFSGFCFYVLAAAFLPGHTAPMSGLHRSLSRIVADRLLLDHLAGRPWFPRGGHDYHAARLDEASLRSRYERRFPADDDGRRNSQRGARLRLLQREADRSEINRSGGRHFLRRTCQ